MVVEVERLLVRLEVTQSRFERQMRNANRKADRTARGIEARFQGMNANVQRSFTGLGSILVGGLGLREVVGYADAWAVAGNKIAAAGQVAGIAGRSLEGINEIASGSRSGLTETADLYAKLLRATKGVAESELEVARATEIVNKAFKAGGAAVSEQTAGILQLAQGLSSGILQGDELRSIRENAPLVAQAIADEFRTTIGGLKELGAQGELTSARVFRAILNAQAPIEAAFAKTNATIGDGITNLRNALTEYVGAASASTGATAKIVSALNGLAENIDLAVAAGVALGARFIGPVLLRQLVTARAVIANAAASLAGLGAGARVAATGLGAIRGVLAVFGGPIGLAITALTALPIVLEDSSEKLARLDQISGAAVGALNSYADASRRAASEQEELGGKVSAATQQILNQNRAQLQQAFSDLREEYAELKSELEDGIVFNSDVTSLGQVFGSAGASNPILASLSEQLKDIGDGAGDISAVSDQLERLAGIGEEASSRVEQFDLALQSAGNVDLSGATQGLVAIATAIGGFSAELAAIENADTLLQQGIAATVLRDALADAAQAGRALRTENAQSVREQLSSASDLKASLDAVGVALDGNVQEAERLAAGIDGGSAAADGIATASRSIDFSGAANSAKSLADQLSRAVGAASTLANQSLSDLRQSQINLDFKDDPVGRAGALAGARFDQRTGDTSGADPILRIALNDQRDAFIEAAEAAERNRGLLSDWEKAQTDAAGAAKRGASESAKSAEEMRKSVEALEESISDQGISLQRQREEFGLTSAEVARLRAEYALLDQAKRAGISLDLVLASTGETVRDSISKIGTDVQAATASLENNQEVLSGVMGTIDDISKNAADIFTDGDIKNKGDALRDSLRDTFRGIARDILASGIRAALTQSLTPAITGGGGGIIQSIGSALGLFMDGGFTGRGARTEPAGIVHKGEYVFDKAATQRIGVNRLEDLRSGRLPGYMSGGLVGTTSLSSPARGVGRDALVVRLMVPDGVTAEQATQIAAGVTLEVVQDNNRKLEKTIPGIVAESQARI